MPDYSTVQMISRGHGEPCPYCGKTMLRGTRRLPTRDHVRPRSTGGTLSKGNCLIVCAPCNGEKGSKSLFEFLEALSGRNDPRAERVRALVHSGAGQPAHSESNERINPKPIAETMDALQRFPNIAKLLPRR